jgi:hypothetical protein
VGTTFAACHHGFRRHKHERAEIQEKLRLS